MTSTIANRSPDDGDEPARDRPRSRVRGWGVRLLLLLGSLLFSLLVSEWFVRGFTRFPISKWSNRVRHETLGFVLSRDLPNVDRWGFRNPAVPERSDLVMIGDSHTYGNNVAMSQSWPYQLGRMVDRSVYGMAVPEYGILHYYSLYRRARDQLDPDYVLVGFFPANDLQAQSCLLFNKPFWRRQLERRLLELGDCKERATRFAPLEAGLLARLEGLHQLLAHLVVDPLRHRLILDTGFFAKGYYRFVSGARRAVVSKRVVRIHARESRLANPEVRTMDRNARRLFRWMARDAREHGIRFGVLVLPSKERVHLRWARRRQIRVPESFRRRVADQETLRRRYLEFFRAHDIPVKDALDPMVEVLDRAAGSWDPLYPIDDGHPDEPEGYGAYARTGRRLFEALRNGRGTDPESKDPVGREKERPNH